MIMSYEETVIEKMTLEEIEAVAGKNVKQEVWEWVNGGTETEFTLQRNHLALERILLRLRVLHALEKANTTVKILGQTVRTPIIVAPFANMVQTHPEAERAIAQGAEKAGAMMFLGSVSTYSAAQIAEVAHTPLVWIGEPLKDREKLLRQMRQAEKAGCSAVGLCADDFMGVKIKDRLLPLSNDRHI